MNLEIIAFVVFCAAFIIFMWLAVLILRPVVIFFRKQKPETTRSTTIKATTAKSKAIKTVKKISKAPVSAVKKNSDFKILCTCGNQTHLPDRINEEKVTIKNINQFYRKLICSSCGERKAKVYLLDDLILDLSKIKLCAECNNPIPITRLDINPEANECVYCIEAREDEESKKISMKGYEP